MRIATWNVNSLKARMERVEEWLAQRSPDVLLMQETKLADEAAPEMPFAMAGYSLTHHGEGRWNGVAIASRVGISDVVTNFGDGPVRHSPGPETGTSAVVEALEAEASEASADEARMISAVCGGIRVVSVYAPNGRALDTPFYRAKLAWFERLARWLREACDPAEPLRHRRRLQRGARGCGRLRHGRLCRRHSRLGARASRGGRAARVGPGGRLPAAPPRAGQVLVVGLPGRQLPQGPGDAHRPPVRHPIRGRSLHRLPRSTVTPARASSPRTTPRSTSTWRSELGAAEWARLVAAW